LRTAPPEPGRKICLDLCYKLAKASDEKETIDCLREIPLEKLGLAGLMLRLKRPWGEEEIHPIFSPRQAEGPHQQPKEKGEILIHIKTGERELGELLITPEKGEATGEIKETWNIIAHILATTLARVWKEKELYKNLLAKEKEIKELLEELKKSKEAQTILIKRVSHELRTPLHSILGFSQLMEEIREDLPPQAQSYISLITDKAKEMKNTIEDISLLWHLRQKNEKIALQELDLTPFINGIIESLQNSILDKKLKVHVRIEPGRAFLDRDKMERALHHLFSNAVKFTPPEGDIGITVDKAPSGIKIAVWDTGIGIPPEYMEEIWEPFKQLEDPLTRRYQGMGIGLSLVKKIVESHGGEVWVEKGRGGRGASFVMFIPQPPQKPGGDHGRTY